MSVLENISEKIKNSNSILILTHENPDGDAMGSTLALYNAVRKLDKKCVVYIPHPNKIFTFLPGYNDIHTGENVPSSDDFDLVIALDSGDADRLGIAKDLFAKIEKSICIDHHITNQNFADDNYVNAVASSTCENLMVVLASMEIAINKEIGECLYTGILTDTGGFRYSCKPETMEIVATIMETGINYKKIYQAAFDSTSLNKLKLSGRCIDRLELLNNDTVVFTYVSLKDLEELGLEETDSDGIVNIGRDIDSVEVSILAKERPENGCKISLRSNDIVDVSIIASKFGGGGHVRAAGFESALPLEQIKQMIVEEVEKQLKDNKDVAE